MPLSPLTGFTPHVTTTAGERVCSARWYQYAMHWGFKWQFITKPSHAGSPQHRSSRTTAFFTMCVSQTLSDIALSRGSNPSSYFSSLPAVLYFSRKLLSIQAHEKKAVTLTLPKASPTQVAGLAISSLFIQNVNLANTKGCAGCSLCQKYSSTHGNNQQQSGKTEKSTAVASNCKWHLKAFLSVPTD